MGLSLFTLSLLLLLLLPPPIYAINSAIMTDSCSSFVFHHQDGFDSEVDCADIFTNETKTTFGKKWGCSLLYNLHDALFILGSGHTLSISGVLESKSEYGTEKLTVLLPPSNPFPVTAAIYSPLRVSLCQETLFFKSVGNPNGCGVLQYDWEVPGIDFGEENILGDRETLILPTNLLQGINPVTVNLVVKDEVGQFDSTSISIPVEVSLEAVVSVAGLYEGVAFDVGRLTHVSAVVEPVDCEEERKRDSATRQVLPEATYHWEVYGGFLENPEDQLSPLWETSEISFQVGPGADLDPVRDLLVSTGDESYTLFMSATLDLPASRVAEQTYFHFSVNWEQSATIIGGEFHTLFPSGSVILEGQLTRPDPLATVHWKCIDSETLEPCKNLTDPSNFAEFPTVRSLTVFAEDLEMGTYLFSATFTSSDSTIYSTQSVEIARLGSLTIPTNFLPLTAYIDIQPGYDSHPSGTPLSIFGYCLPKDVNLSVAMREQIVDPPNVVFEWRILWPLEKDQLLDEGPTSQDSNTVPRRSRSSFSFTRKELPDNGDLLLQLSCRYQKEQGNVTWPGIGQAKKQVKILGAPSGGACSVLQSVGFEYSTDFVISCDGFKGTGSRSLEYSVGFLDTDPRLGESQWNFFPMTGAIPSAPVIPVNFFRRWLSNVSDIRVSILIQDGLSFQRYDMKNAITLNWGDSSSRLGLVEEAVAQAKSLLFLSPYKALHFLRGGARELNRATVNSEKPLSENDVNSWKMTIAKLTRSLLLDPSFVGDDMQVTQILQTLYELASLSQASGNSSLLYWPSCQLLEILTFQVSQLSFWMAGHVSEIRSSTFRSQYIASTIIYGINTYDLLASNFLENRCDLDLAVIFAQIRLGSVALGLGFLRYSPFSFPLIEETPLISLSVQKARPLDLDGFVWGRQSQGENEDSGNDGNDGLDRAEPSQKGYIVVNRDNNPFDNYGNFSIPELNPINAVIRKEAFQSTLKTPGGIGVGVVVAWQQNIFAFLWLPEVGDQYGDSRVDKRVIDVNIGGATQILDRTEDGVGVLVSFGSELDLDPAPTFQSTEDFCFTLDGIVGEEEGDITTRSQLNSASCVFANIPNKSWDAGGCVEAERWEGGVRCCCSHLTSFCVLLTGLESGSDWPDSVDIAALVLIGSAFILVALFIALVNRSQAFRVQFHFESSSETTSRVLGDGCEV